jgi:hypothetical protein
MPTTKKSHGSGVPDHKIHQKGMVDREPKVPDASMGCKGGSVDSEPTRNEVARSHSIGGREA